ncbi:MAG: hypothetical protein M3Q75_04785 [Gemmatimonadota bacterium]|nr:hypothetical protein [Gemmatimonadota bacterium]
MASFNVSEVAPLDETRTRTFKLLGHPSEVTYYPNRITLEPSGETTVASDDDGETDDEVSEANAAARQVCRLVAAWDWTGPVPRGDGTLIVGHDEPIPIEPEIVQCVQTRIIRALNDAISEDAFPNTRNERRLRRR